MPQSARLSAGEGVQWLFGQCPNEQRFSFGGASLTMITFMIIMRRREDKGSEKVIGSFWQIPRRISTIWSFFCNKCQWNIDKKIMKIFISIKYLAHWTPLVSGQRHQDFGKWWFASLGSPWKALEVLGMPWKALVANSHRKSASCSEEEKIDATQYGAILIQ